MGIQTLTKRKQSTLKGKKIAHKKNVPSRKQQYQIAMDRYLEEQYYANTKSKQQHGDDDPEMSEGERLWREYTLMEQTFGVEDGIRTTSDEDEESQDDESDEEDWPYVRPVEEHHHLVAKLGHGDNSKHSALWREYKRTVAKYGGDRLGLTDDDLLHDQFYVDIDDEDDDEEDLFDWPHVHPPEKVADWGNVR